MLARAASASAGRARRQGGSSASELGGPRAAAEACARTCAMKISSEKRHETCRIAVVAAYGSSNLRAAEIPVLRELKISGDQTYVHLHDRTDRRRLATSPHRPSTVAFGRTGRCWFCASAGPWLRPSPTQRVRRALHRAFARRALGAQPTAAAGSRFAACLRLRQAPTRARGSR